VTDEAVRRPNQRASRRFARPGVGVAAHRVDEHICHAREHRLAARPLRGDSTIGCLVNCRNPRDSLRRAGAHARQRLDQSGEGARRHRESRRRSSCRRSRRAARRGDVDAVVGDLPTGQRSPRPREPVRGRSGRAAGAAETTCASPCGENRTHRGEELHRRPARYRRQHVPAGPSVLHHVLDTRSRAARLRAGGASETADVP